jgi:hypothetical protein
MKSIKSFRLILFLSAIVIVSCKKDKVNPPPVAVAGNSQSIQLPVDSAILNGSGSSTDGKIVGYLWSEVSGPNVPVIASESSASTIVRGMITGTYIFQFMVIDNLGLSAVDTVSINVTPSPIDSLILQPANNPNEMNVAIYNGADYSGPSIEMPIEAWTKQSLPLTIRELLKFDLSSIPSSATIISANLLIYSDTIPLNGNLINPNSGSNNTMLLQQVAIDWSPTAVNWFNQPAVSTNNQITIPTTTSSTLNLNIDVTAIVSSQISNNTNYGFLMRLQNEVTYNSRIFCSSRYSDASRHPKLVIYYKFN